ncbi:MAG: S9 family peptidase [Lewinellaceae bacterium]|nr:S9 family peptidase [Lewinellaceae bacterium]
MFLRSILFSIGLATLFLAGACQPKTTHKESMMYHRTDLEAPKAKQIPKELTSHGDTRQDPYYWLNERENPEVIAYLKSENAYQEEMMSHLKGFQEKLYEEIIGRIRQTDMSVPYLDNGYYYFSRYEEGLEYPILSRKKGSLDAAEEVLLNVNELAKPYAFYQVGGTSVSPDNKLLAFGEDTLSRRIYTLRFKNLETGEFLEDQIPNTNGGGVWANDNKTVFYSVKDASLRSYKIFKHKLGTPATDDVEVYHEADETFGVGIGKTKSKKYLVIASYQTLSTEFRYLDANDPDGEFRIIQPRERDHEYNVDHYGDSWYIRTNWQAKNFRLMKTPEDKTGKENWTEVIPHRDDVLLEGMELFNGYLVLEERQNALLRLRIKPWAGGEEHYVDFGEEAYMVYPTSNYEFDTDLIRVGYTSLTTPNSIFDYNMKTRELTLLKEQEVVGDFDKNNYHTERLFATARDGVKVPITLVYRNGFKKDGTAPLLLYGYGSYGFSMDPSFNSARLSLLDRGFVYAIAHIRGGEEMGRQWYEDGKLLKKMNTFTDFIDCGEFLVKEKYCAKDQLYAMGGSAGGLLMGAVVNLRPDLWKGVIAAVPFVDVVTTMLDESIPLTTGEYDEWGNPNDKTYYDYIKSYSPYDNVEAKEYPAMLVTTGLHDSQVQYWEPAKWVARLREMKTDQNPLLLHTNLETGHSGASGRFQRYKETALDFAFLLDLAGLSELEQKE